MNENVTMEEDTYILTKNFNLKRNHKRSEDKIFIRSTSNSYSSYRGSCSSC